MRLRNTAVLLAAIALIPAVGWTQAAAEYGLAAGKSAAATSGAASALNKANRRLTQAIGQKTTSAVGNKAQSNTYARRSVAPHTAPATTQGALGNAAATLGPANSGLVIETGKERITLGQHGSQPQTAEASATAKKPDPTRPATQNRYPSVISLPAN